MRFSVTAKKNVTVSEIEQGRPYLDKPWSQVGVVPSPYAVLAFVFYRDMGFSNNPTARRFFIAWY